MTDFPADSILVLLEATPTGELATSAAGLLAAASQVGTPVALAVTTPGRAQSLAEQAAALGADRVLAVETASASSDLTIPQVDALAAAAALVAPEAVLVSNSIDGRDVAGRFAARTGAAIAVDAIGVSRDDEGVIGAPYSDTVTDGVLFRLESWVRPAEILQAEASGAIRDTKLLARPTIDVSKYESTRIFATAKDGTQVPVSVVYRKGMSRDGSAPTMLDAYGSYGISSTAYFAPRMIAFLEHGGVWATAHVRGGGEYGREWHEGGRLLTKHNTWGDMIAASEALIAQKWTSPSKLAIRGGSAGGITVGRSLTERPDLFALVISQVGVSNNLRMEFSQNGPPNVPEFGSVSWMISPAPHRKPVTLAGMSRSLPSLSMNVDLPGRPS